MEQRAKQQELREARQGGAVIEFAMEDAAGDENAAPMAVELYLELPKPTWYVVTQSLRSVYS